MSVQHNESSVTKESGLNDLFTFVSFINKFRRIERTILYAGVDGPERNGEHVFQLAVCCWFLNERLGLGFDSSLIIKLALCHEFVEIYAGDTPVFPDKSGAITGSTVSRNDKKERETVSMKKVRDEWLDTFPDMIEYMEMYENQDCEESRFVFATDKLISTINIYQDDGRTWHKLRATYEQLDAYKRVRCEKHELVGKLWDELSILLKQNHDLFPVQTT